MGAGHVDVATLGLALAVAAALLACRCAAQAPASGVGGSGCIPELVSLSPCMGYMSGNATAPGAACCSAVSGVLASSPGCLCAVIGGTAATLGVATLDGARATQLPGACRVQAPPASQCNAMGVPMPSPAAAGSTPATRSDPSAVGPDGSGSKATPGPRYSGGGNINVAGRTLAFAVGVAAVALIHGVA